MPAGSDLKSELVRFATDAGFDRCRIARCDPPPHADEFNEWLEAGAAGEMAYMARGAEKRSDPQIILPGARSVISLALNYWQGAAPEARTGVSNSEPGNAVGGRIARYAWGDDYHELIEEKLAKIDEFLQT